MLRRDEVERPQLVVCASGNLGLIYVTSRAGRVSLERIEAAYPDLVDGLRREPGIGFVLAHSERTGPLVLGRAGRRYLAEDHVGAAVEGEDPLASFGPHAAAALRRLDSFPHCGDLAVNSLLDPITDGVASFEELAGSHGGLGGPQTAPFLIFPAEWELPAGRIEGAPAVHAVLRRWLERLPPGKIDRVSERSK